ncbi:AMP-binding protein [Streptomyces rishiriensis]|uniref:AMP-binding protein n=1 Tax=Streptomyces rishiriensis TaxID=68264 RepID=UPI0037D55BD7
MSAADRVAELTATFTAPSLDVAGLLCDQHPADRVAFTVVDGTGGASTLSYGELATDSHRYARALQGLGVGPGDRVATLMGKGTDLVTLILAIWRLGAVYVPLFTAFAPQAIALRLEGAGAHVVVVDPDQRRKLNPGPDMPDDPRRRVVVTGTAAHHRPSSGPPHSVPPPSPQRHSPSAPRVRQAVRSYPYARGGSAFRPAAIPRFRAGTLIGDCCGDGPDRLA